MRKYCTNTLYCTAHAGLSKFLGGMLGAAFSLRLMLALGLITTSAGFCNYTLLHCSQA